MGPQDQEISMENDMSMSPEHDSTEYEEHEGLEYTRVYRGKSSPQIVASLVGE